MTAWMAAATDVEQLHAYLDACASIQAALKAREQFTTKEVARLTSDCQNAYSALKARLRNRSPIRSEERGIEAVQSAPGGAFFVRPIVPGHPRAERSRT